jgi:glycosyltransferase involved in cell wall biosynthesis
MTRVDISVVIPFAGDPELLTAQVDALQRQVIDAPWELVVSRNGREPLPPVPSSVVVVDSSDIPGPSHARNVGWRAARGSLVLFCDADDLVADGWIAAMAGALADDDLVRGRVDYSRLNPPGAALGRPSEVGPHPTYLHHLPFAPSCALAVRRHVLEAVDGFDESMRSGEDIDLSWRAQYAGFTLGYAHDALLHYRLRRGARQLFEQGRLYGAGDAVLLGVHREHGARRSPWDSVREIVTVVGLGFSAIVRPGSRRKFALRAGYLVGHVDGWARTGNWAV